MDQFCECKKCGKLIRLSLDNTYWDESGYGYSTKIAKCECGMHNILKYEEDSWFKDYKKKRY